MKLSIQKNYSVLNLLPALRLPIILSGLVAAHVASGVERSWENADGGVFNVGSNWSGDTVPGAGDTAFFDLSNEDPMTITFSDNVSLDAFNIANGSYTFNLANGNGGYTLSTTIDNEWDHVGNGVGTNGSLEIINGTVSSFRATIGEDGGTGHVTVGSGGTWNLSGTNSVMVGFGGTGSLTLEAGGKVNTVRLSVGSDVDGTGSVTITGSGSRYTTNRFAIVGQSGVGSLTIADGGTLESINLTSDSTRYAAIARNSGSEGTVLVTGSGSIWTLKGNLALTVGGGVSEAGGDGSLMVMNGGVVDSQAGFYIWESGLVGGNSSLIGNVTNAGTVSPGNSTGTLSITGDYTQEVSGTLTIELGGVAAGEYDVLAVSGDVSLGGSLTVSLINDFDLGFNETYLILSAEGTLIGEFLGLGEGELVGTFGGIDLYITYDPESVFGADFAGVGLYTIPEPTSVAMLFATVLGALLFHRNRRKSSNVLN